MLMDKRLKLVWHRCFREIQKETRTFLPMTNGHACLLPFRMTLSLLLGISLNYIPLSPTNAIITIINDTWHKPRLGIMVSLWCNAGGFLVGMSGSQILRVLRYNDAKGLQGTSHTTREIQFHLWVHCSKLNLSLPICNLFQIDQLYQYYLERWLKRCRCLWSWNSSVGIQLETPWSMALWGGFGPAVNHSWLYVNCAADSILHCSLLTKLSVVHK